MPLYYAAMIGMGFGAILSVFVIWLVDTYDRVSGFRR